MTASLSLPIKWESFKQAVMLAYACDKRHKTTCFTICHDIATKIHADEGFSALPHMERQLFNLIWNAVIASSKQAKEDDKPRQMSLDEYRSTIL
jgi:hypothetical protein